MLAILCYLNTQYMTNLTTVYPVQMEYGWNFSIFGLKMMVKSGLEKNIFDIPPWIFYGKEEFWSNVQIQ